MITTNEVKIKKNEKFTSEYIEKELKNSGYDVIRWAITGCDNDHYTVSIANIIK